MFQILNYLLGLYHQIKRKTTSQAAFDNHYIIVIIIIVINHYINLRYIEIATATAHASPATLKWSMKS